jgi:hypothetical protein
MICSNRVLEAFVPSFNGNNNLRASPCDINENGLYTVSIPMFPLRTLIFFLLPFMHSCYELVFLPVSAFFFKSAAIQSVYSEFLAE